VPLSGTFTLDEAAGTLALTENNIPTLSQTFVYTLTGGTLTLVNASAGYDFDQDGTPDSSTLTLGLTRQ